MRFFLFFLMCFLWGGFSNAASLEDVEEKKLLLYGWDGSIDPAVIEQFSKETGIVVTFDFYDNDEIPEAKLLMGKTGYDIIMPSNPYFARQIKLELYQPLDHKLLPNRRFLDPAILKKLEAIDPGNKFGMPLTWGTIGIGYNKEKVAELFPQKKFKGGALLFDPEVVERLAGGGGVIMLDNPHDVMLAVLTYLGVKDPAALGSEALEKAAALLKKVRPHIAFFSNSEDAVMRALLDGSAIVAEGLSGGILRARAIAKESGKPFNIDYIIPEEGAAMWIDMLAIPNGAPHFKNAHLFIDFLMRPEVALANALYSMQATANLKAREMLPDTVKNDPLIYPPQKVMASLILPAPHNLLKEREVTRLWYKIKMGL